MTSHLTHSPEGNILTPAGWMRGRILVDGPVIGSIAAEPCQRPEDNDLPLILPGFVDLHIHGGNGTDYADGEDGIRAFIRYHARHGTVALTPTTSTAPIPVIDAALAEHTEGLLGDASPLVRAMAVWALKRLLSDAAFAEKKSRAAGEGDAAVLAEWAA